MSPIQLALFDLRFPGSEAAIKYQGHVNETFEQSMVRLVHLMSPSNPMLSSESSLSALRL